MTFERFWHQFLHRPYKLHNVSHGVSDKPVVVLLHGEDWSHLIPLLTPHYRCITIDLLGFAKSPKPTWSDYTMEDHVRAIHHTLSGMGLRKELILVGHSLGSLLATRYARRHPRHIKRLLLLSPPVYPPLESITGKAALKRTDWLIKVYRLLRTNPRLTPENVKRLKYLMPIPRTVYTHPDTWLPFCRSLEHCIEQQTITRDIRNLRMPIDIFYGTLDTLIVGSNVRAVARLRDVEVHAFRGRHGLTRGYAKLVADRLIP
jgi:pimeloyl-ACP methyl ester carboxylesterase